jgi:hypothetical protein
MKKAPSLMAGGQAEDTRAIFEIEGSGLRRWKGTEDRASEWNERAWQNAVCSRRLTLQQRSSTAFSNSTKTAIVIFPHAPALRAEPSIRYGRCIRCNGVLGPAAWKTR